MCGTPSAQDASTTALSEEGYQTTLAGHDSSKAAGLSMKVVVDQANSPSHRSVVSRPEYGSHFESELRM